MTGSSVTLEALRGPAARRRRESIVRGAFLLAAATSMLISILIVVALVGEAWTFISRVDLSVLVSDGWLPRRGRYDLATLFAGTLVITAVAMLIAAPLGLGAAIYLSEYASPRMRRALKPVLEILAGIPSVVLGFFALAVLAPAIIQPVCGSNSLFSMGAAGLGVGIMITPLIASVAEDAMHAVPLSLREASYGLGARKRSTSLRIVVPAAVSGIVAALILGVSRAIGETMVVAIAAGAVGGSAFTINPCFPGQTMTAAMTALATGSDQARGDQLAFPSLFFVGLLLFVITLGLNLLSERFVRAFRRAY
ncbi:MAG: phosphate ABC transporter permease subunit PstC [Candidatus Limnocylindrales bacterium]